MIEAKLAKHFPEGLEFAAFSIDVEFTAKAGITALFGPSGAGKTLILDCIAGFVKPDTGRILLDGQILFDAPARVHLPPRDRRCGYVFQNYALFPHLTLRENLEFGAGQRKRLDGHRKVNELLETFRLQDVAGRKPHQLSGGQKQRCSIARALATEPKLLLLDEPARGLDLALRMELYETLRQVQREFKTPVLLVTHSLEECFELADEMLILREGRLIRSGKPQELSEQPGSIEMAELLGIHNILPAEIRSLDPSRNESVLRYGDTDLRGPYFPGHLIGDRVEMIVTPQQLRAIPRTGRAGQNQAAATLLRCVQTPQYVRLEFKEGIMVEMPRREFLYEADNKDWWVEFPVKTLRIL